MDDLLDLNWSAPSPAKLSTPQPPTTGANGGTSFDFLTHSKVKPQSGTGTPNYYSSTPLRTSTPSQPPQPNNNATRPAPSSGRSTPLQAPALSAAAPTSSVGGVGGGGMDAFSSLLSIPSSNGLGLNGKNMTMADKQKAMENEKRRKEAEEKKQFEAESHFWDNLGTGSGSASTSASAPISGLGLPKAASLNGGPIKSPHGDLDDFLKPSPAAKTSSSRGPSPIQPMPSKTEIIAPTPASAAATSSSAGTFWDKYDDSDDFLVASSSSANKPSPTSRSPAPPVDPFDFDALAASVPTHSQSRSQSQSRSGGSSMRTPVSDFDFGDREARDDNDDDILGDLGKPVTAKRVEPKPGPSRASKQASGRSSSPPPHIVGQIVEMGFSPAQARQALSTTESGLDVQAALENLLGGQATGSASRAREQDDFPEDDGEMIERERQRREEEERERRRRRRAGPSRESVRARTTEQQANERGPGDGNPSDQAEKYLAQASEIGTNMFKQATSFWNSSKEKALKVYEEQRKAMEANLNAEAKEGASSRKPVKDGRPRWMTEVVEEGYPEEKRSAAGGIRDGEDGDDHEPARRPRQANERANQEPSGAGPSRHARPSSPPRRQGTDRSSEYRSAKERADLLFADEGPSRYVSPARHPKRPVAVASSTRRPVTPAAPLPARQLVPASAQQLQSSAAHKAKGNEHFKLGRFPEAESSYSSAISSLPDKHLFLVPLHNNRAAARLKLGDSGPAASDCTVVIDLIGPAYHPSKEAALPPDVASEVKLADGLVKALTKRAQAWEMGEKWKNALEDWEKLVGLDLSMLGVAAGATKTLAVEGARRSRKMLEGSNGTRSTAAGNTSAAIPSNVASKPKARPQPATTAANVDRSAAVSELRKAAQVQEAEDVQRLALRDSVEAKLNAWKGGKETNLRALIASLDSVLWDEMLKGGLKVGMHELIAEKQVKIKYMKVIARLHPDKISTSNTTVEQRMLAAGAFGILNEAWQAFSK